MKNSTATRTFSDQHEKSVCSALGAVQTANSGAGKFNKGDVIQRDASMLIECKCCMSEKQSIAVKKEWIDKNVEEMYQMGLGSNAVCINFQPDGDNFYIINERLMKYLCEKLSEE